jgi:hypothetical protein
MTVSSSARLDQAPRCSACAEVQGSIVAPGGVIFDNGLWFVSHHTGRFTDPGELIVKRDAIASH